MTAQSRASVALQPFDPQQHLHLLGTWLSAPHVFRFWGAPNRALSEASRRKPGSAALILVDGHPIGYICWQKPSVRELAEAGLSDLPAGIMDIDLLIGNPDFIGQSIGPRALGILLARLRSEGTSFAGVGTSLDNRSAIRAYEKNRFQAIS